MKKWITSQALNYHFNISIRAHKLNKILKGTPYIKKSNIRCGVNGTYHLYDLDYLMDKLGFIPKNGLNIPFYPDK